MPDEFGSAMEEKLVVSTSYQLSAFRRDWMAPALLTPDQGMSQTVEK